MPNAGALADRYVDALNQAMTASGISTTEQRAAFLAQVAAESGDLHDTVEKLTYSAQRAAQVWPGRLPNAVAAAPYAHNPEALADYVYADRIGHGLVAKPQLGREDTRCA